jgi:parallel beta-helix repeat protein
VIVQNSEAASNVSGIEIENTFFADVFGNDAHDNTAGILVFDLPNLQQLGGHDVRVHDNKIHDNNTKNFAASGDIVGLVPSGTGFFVMANSNVEIFNNAFTNNSTVQSAVISYYVSQIKITDPNYYPIPSKIFIHDNTYAGGGKSPDVSNNIGLLLDTVITKFPNGVVPEILYDGVTDPMKTTPPNNPMQICVKNAGAVVANLHLDKLNSSNTNLAQIMVVDSAPYDCTLPPVAPVTLP